eukprot:7913528-Pyramimonas_sp.AAC.2
MRVGIVGLWQASAAFPVAALPARRAQRSRVRSQAPLLFADTGSTTWCSSRAQSPLLLARIQHRQERRNPAWAQALPPFTPQGLVPPQWHHVY